MNAEAQLHLTELLEQLLVKLDEMHYSKVSIGTFRRHGNKLLHYANALGEKYISQDLQLIFINDVYGTAHRESRKVASRLTDMLLSMQECGEIFTKRIIKSSFPDGLAAVYEEFLQELHGRIREKTFLSYRANLMRTANFFSANGIVDISQVTQDIVIAFTLTLSELNGRYANEIMALLSKLLKFAAKNGYSDTDKSAYCMKVRIVGGEKVPTTFTKTEIERILAVPDRDTPAGKRDYAFMLLASRTGLRGCDIFGLKFSNLRFDTDTIELSQSKTGKRLILPLSEEVGLALIDYIKNGRPAVGSEYVFTQLVAPFKPLSSSANYTILKYMESAGIKDFEKRKPGIRSFRQSLASHMLESRIPIHIIKEQLGHESIDTTMRYIKIDKHSLRTCALEVPVLQR